MICRHRRRITDGCKECLGPEDWRVVNTADHPTIDPYEVGNTYVGPEDRFVVSLIVGYPSGECDVHTPEQAAAMALELTRDEGSSDTHWYVYDRETKQLQIIEQRYFEGLTPGTWPCSHEFAMDFLEDRCGQCGQEMPEGWEG